MKDILTKMKGDAIKWCPPDLYDSLINEYKPLIISHMQDNGVNAETAFRQLRAEAQILYQKNLTMMGAAALEIKNENQKE